MLRFKRLAVAVVLAVVFSSFAVVAQAKIPGPSHVPGSQDQSYASPVAGGGTELVKGGIGGYYVS